MDSTRTEEIKKKCEKLRILVIGRGNAGKTTILQRVCNTTEAAKVYDARGDILPFIPEGSTMRGEHDIENEMVFESNPGFIFHDSRGFESGGKDELDKVKAFITERSQHAKLAQRLHAIWYCIPVNESRPFTAAEDWFFSECASDSVPVIAIFTKFDALDDKAFKTLRKEKVSRADAKSRATSRAMSDFKKQHSDPFYELYQYRPKGEAFLRDMHEGGNCSELVEQTAAAFDDEILQQLFVSTQWNNLELYTMYSLKRELMPSITREIEKGTWSSLFGDNLRKKEANRLAIELVGWFPQFGGRLLHLLNLLDDDDDNLLDLELDLDRLLDDDLLLDRNRRFLDRVRVRDLDRVRDLVNDVHKELSGSSGSFPSSAHRIATFGLAVVISAQHSFFLWSQSRSIDAFIVALRQYVASPQSQAVANAVGEIDFTKSTFVRLGDNWRSETFQKLLQIAHDNRLPVDDATTM